MRVEDYEYMENDDLEENETLTDERKEELIKKVKDQIVRNNIALFRILRIGKNGIEYNFLYNWLTQNKVGIRGTNGTLSGELDDYSYIKKLGIEKYPEPLKEEEQQQLFLKLNNMKENGIDTDSEEYQEIRQKLITHNIRLALWTVQVKESKYLDVFEMEKEDLEQIAMEALIRSVDGYKVKPGYKFSSYVIPTVYYSVIREWNKSRSNDTQLGKESVRLEKFKEEMLKSINRQPTDEEIMEFLGIGNKRLKLLKEYINYHFQESTEELNKVEEEEIIDNLFDDEIIEEADGKPIVNGVYLDDTEKATLTEPRDVYKVAEVSVGRRDINRVFDKKLSDREKKLFKLRLGQGSKEGMTFENLGKEFNVSPECTRQWMGRALRKLRRPTSIEILEGYRDGFDIDDVNYYDEIHEGELEKKQIVDGIKVEKYRPSEKENKINMQFDNAGYIYQDKKPQTNDEHHFEDIANDDKSGQEELGLSSYEQTLEQFDDIEENSKSNNYLNEISNLLSELKELDEMIRQTSIEIKSEKDKKNQNKLINEKIKKVKSMMQSGEGER